MAADIGPRIRRFAGDCPPRTTIATSVRSRATQTSSPSPRFGPQGRREQDVAIGQSRSDCDSRSHADKPRGGHLKNLSAGFCSSDCKVSYLSAFISGSISGLGSFLRLPFFAPHFLTDSPQIDSLAYGYGLNDFLCTRYLACVEVGLEVRLTNWLPRCEAGGGRCSQAFP